MSERGKYPCSCHTSLEGGNNQQTLRKGVKAGKLRGNLSGGAKKKRGHHPNEEGERIFNCGFTRGKKEVQKK